MVYFVRADEWASLRISPLGLKEVRASNEDEERATVAEPRVQIREDLDKQRSLLNQEFPTNAPSAGQTDPANWVGILGDKSTLRSELNEIKSFRQPFLNRQADEFQFHIRDSFRPEWSAWPRIVQRSLQCDYCLFLCQCCLERSDKFLAISCSAPTRRRFKVSAFRIPGYLPNRHISN